MLFVKLMKTSTVPLKKLNPCCNNLRLPVRYEECPTFSSFFNIYVHICVHRLRETLNLEYFMKLGLVWFGVKVEDKVLRGPKDDLVGFLEACDTLHTNVEYLTFNRSLKASDTALTHARDLFSKGMSRLEEEFRALLTAHRLVSGV